VFLTTTDPAVRATLLAVADAADQWIHDRDRSAVVKAFNGG
jgi:hypothetical protein